MLYFLCCIFCVVWNCPFLCFVRVVCVFFKKKQEKKWCVVLPCYIFTCIEFLCHIFMRVEFVLYLSACGTRSGISCYTFPHVERALVFCAIFFCVWSFVLYFFACGILCYIFRVWNFWVIFLCCIFPSVWNFLIFFNFSLLVVL